MARPGEPEDSDFLQKVIELLQPMKPKDGEDLQQIIHNQNVQNAYIRNRALIERCEREQNKLVNVIRIFGIKEEPGEDLKQKICVWFLGELYRMVVPDDIQYCYRRGYINEINPRSVVVKLKDHDMVEKILEQYNEVLKLGKGKLSYRISPELCPERKMIRDEAIERYGRSRVRLNGTKIEVSFPEAFPRVFSCLEEYNFFVKEEEEAAERG